MVHSLVQNTGIGDSNHESWSFDLNCYKEECKERKIPNYQKADFETIRNRLNDIDWVPLLRGNFLNAYCKCEAALVDATKD